MIPLQDIQDYANKIAERFRPEKIILFGSQARGEANWDSDVDIMVVMDFEGQAVRQALSIWNELDAPFTLDLLVRRSKDIDARMESRDYFLREIVDTGIILYDSRSLRLD
jgi:predicted nucleotidyltransferase